MHRLRGGTTSHVLEHAGGMDILLDHVTAGTAPRGMTHRIARLTPLHGTTATTAPTPCPCGVGVTTLVAGVDLTPLCPHNPAALEPTSPVMIQAVEVGDGWTLWLRDGVPVVWIRDLGGGWVELRWYREHRNRNAEDGGEYPLHATH